MCTMSLEGNILFMLKSKNIFFFYFPLPPVLVKVPSHFALFIRFLLIISGFSFSSQRERFYNYAKSTKEKNKIISENVQLMPSASSHAWLGLLFFCCFADAHIKSIDLRLCIM